jgi:phospholipase/carboxylesterase
MTSLPGTEVGTCETETASYPAPVVARWGSADPADPLVVLLHGRGASEASMAELAPVLPAGPGYAAVRAPIAEGGGYAWFANRGIGRPLPDSLAATMAWFREWLAVEARPGRPIVLLGFSGGAAFAGGLLLAQPERFAAGILLFGTLPFDAGVPVTRGRLSGVPVFLTHGIHDTVIPAELLARTWDYLVRSSGSAVWATREPAAHELTSRTVAELGQWLTERLDWVRQNGRTTPPGPAQWPTLPGGTLPERTGEPPEVSVTTPQQQETQNSPAELQETLYARLAALDAVTTAPSRISVPGARAFVLDRAAAGGPDEAYILPDIGEFAHLHPEYDGSLHLVLPVAQAFDSLAKGWAVAHPLAGIRLTPGMVMVFGPRDDTELDVVAGIVAAGHAYAAGG